MGLVTLINVEYQKKCEFLTPDIMRWGYKNQYCGGKFLKNFSTPRVVSEFVNEWTDKSRQQGFTWKTRKGKTPGEREFSIISGNYNEFHRVMLRLQVLGFSVIRYEPLEFSVIRFQPTPFLDGEGDVFITAWAVFMGADISDLHHCMIHTLWSPLTP